MNKRITALFMTFAMMFVLIQHTKYGSVNRDVGRFITKTHCLSAKTYIKRLNKDTGFEYKCVSAKDYIPPIPPKK